MISMVREVSFISVIDKLEMSQFKSHRVSSGGIQHSGSMKAISQGGVVRSNSVVANDNIQTPAYVKQLPGFK